MNAPPPFGYYDAPLARSALPAVIVLVRAYAATMTLGYLVVVGSLLGSMVEPRGAIELHLFAVALGVFAALHAVAVFMPRKPWAWTYGLVILVIGIMSGALFFAIPLLVYWLRPQCRAAFMRI